MIGAVSRAAFSKRAAQLLVARPKDGVYLNAIITFYSAFAPFGI